MRVQGVIIAKNEESRIAGCLQSLRPLVDEVILVDGGSSDGTGQVARLSGATVHRSALFTSSTPTEEFDFSAARNEALQYCEPGAWILSIDADEHVEGEGLRAWLEAAAQSTYQVRIKLQGDYSRGDGPLPRRGIVTGHAPRLFVCDVKRRRPCPAAAGTL